MISTAGSATCSLIASQAISQVWSARMACDTSTRLGEGGLRAIQLPISAASRWPRRSSRRSSSRPLGASVSVLACRSSIKRRITVSDSTETIEIKYRVELGRRQGDNTLVDPVKNVMNDILTGDGDGIDGSRV